MSKLTCINLKGMNIFQQLKIEEILLRKTNKNWFLFNYGNECKAIVLGFSGKINELVNVEKAVNDKIEIIRRFTGGGTVIIDKDTIFSTFIMNTEDAKSLPYPKNIMTWSEPIYKEVFSIDSTDLKFSLRENDYVLYGDKKIGGNAQSITKNRWVHHTSFLGKISPDNMKYLLIPKKAPNYRNNRDHLQFLTSLEDIFSYSEFEKRLLLSLEKTYDLEYINIDNLNKHIDEILIGENIDNICRTRREIITL